MNKIKPYIAELPGTFGLATDGTSGLGLTKALRRKVHDGFVPIASAIKARKAKSVARAIGLVLLGVIGAGDSMAQGTSAFFPPGGITESLNNGAANLGMVFTANSNFSVVALGIYDSPDLVSSEIVGLYDQSGNLLASTEVSLSNQVTGVTGGFLFASIAPVAIKAGNQYTVAAFIGNNPWDYGNAPITDPRVTYNAHTYVYANSITLREQPEPPQD